MTGLRCQVLNLKQEERRARGKRGRVSSRCCLWRDRGCRGEQVTVAALTILMASGRKDIDSISLSQ